MEQDIPDGPGIAASTPRARGGRLGPEARRRIGRNLQVFYAGLLTQPIPERFAAPIAEFAARSGEESVR